MVIELPAGPVLLAVETIPALSPWRPASCCLLCHLFRLSESQPRSICDQPQGLLVTSCFDSTGMEIISSIACLKPLKSHRNPAKGQFSQMFASSLAPQNESIVTYLAAPKTGQVSSKWASSIADQRVRSPEKQSTGMLPTNSSPFTS